MNTTNIHRLATAVVCATLAVTAMACGDDDATAAPARRRPARATRRAPAAATTPTTSTASTVDLRRLPPTTIDDSWKQQAAAFCAAYLAAPPPPDWATAGIVAYVAGVREARDRLPSLEAIDYPDELRSRPHRRRRRVASSRRTARRRRDCGRRRRPRYVPCTSLAQSETLLQHVGALLTLGGAECGDPARADNAALNVSLGDVHHVATGFGSVWASPWFGTAIHRVDPASGDVLATIDVGAPARRGCNPPTAA